MVARRISEPGAVLPWRQRAAVMGAVEEEKVSVITGDAFAAVQKVGQMGYPKRMNHFLLDMLIKETFKNSKWHRMHGRPQHACTFRLATWAVALDWPKPTVIQVRNRLVEAGIITFEPDEEIPGDGIIAWNLAFDEWQPIGTTGGKRAGAGNPYFSSPEYQAYITRLKAEKTYQSRNSDYQSSNDSLSKEKRQHAKTPIKLVTSESCEDRQRQGAAAPLRKDLREEIEDKDPPNGGRAQTRASPKFSKSFEVVSEDDIRFKIAAYFWQKRKEFAPELTDPPCTPKGLAKWCDLVRLLLAKHDKETIGRAINFVFADVRWWAGKMSGMERFHRDFARIYTDMQAAQKREERGNGNHKAIQRTPAGAADSPAIVSEREREKQRERDIAAARAGKPPPSAA